MESLKTFPSVHDGFLLHNGKLDHGTSEKASWGDLRATDVRNIKASMKHIIHVFSFNVYIHVVSHMMCVNILKNKKQSTSIDKDLSHHPQKGRVTSVRLVL